MKVELVWIIPVPVPVPAKLVGVATVEFANGADSVIDTEPEPSPEDAPVDTPVTWL